jgi:predicted RNase H-like nuclease (RuvC/YqgF family)
MLGIKKIINLKRIIKQQEAEIKALNSRLDEADKLLLDGMEIIDKTTSKCLEKSKEISNLEFEVARLRREVYEISKLIPIPESKTEVQPPTPNAEE